ncbi:MAG TPA: tetratricopeptide repeat protein [Candidatus Omnitrophota bacterium]|nr:tetratricopeptide repeat protein [Candidatus Omnitrophota bacterium]
MGARPYRAFGYVLVAFLIGIYCHFKKSERNPHYSKIFYKMAQECESRCRREKTRSYYRKVIYHDPNMSDAYYRLALMEEQDGNDGEALMLYKKVTELVSWNDEADFKVGVDYFKEGAFEYAGRYFKQAVKNNYHHNKAHFYLGLIYTREKEYEKATWHYSRCEGIKNEFFYDTYLGKGILLYVQGKESSALNYVDKLVELGRGDLADQLRQFMQTGKYPESLPKIDLTK